MVRGGSRETRSQSVRSESILGFEISIQSIVAAAAQHRLPVKPEPLIASGLHFNHAAQLAAVFSGKPRHHLGHFLHVVSIEIRYKSRGAILGERHPVYDILHLVFLGARMQNTIGFE